MKIRSDFVTNSSSTSFVIITRGDLTKEAFLNLMGVPENSPLQPLFNALFYSLQSNMLPYKQFYDRQREGHGNWTSLLERDFSKQVTERITKAEAEGCNIFVGKLDSDNDLIESFFCTESFEVENDTIYLNALDCAW